MSAFAQRVAAGKIDLNGGTNQALDSQIDEVLERINVRIQEKFGQGTSRAMLKGLEDFEDKLDEISSGQELLATNSSGQPAAQLGSGASQSSTPSNSSNSGSSGGSQPPTPQEALDSMMNSPLLSSGVKNALRRLLNPHDPQVIAVESDGTPVEVKALSNELRDERNENKSGTLANKLKVSETKLADEQDESKPGSLAGKLKAAKAVPATPAGTVAKADVKSELDKVKAAADDLDTSMMSSKIDGLTELEQAIKDAEQLVS